MEGAQSGGIFISYRRDDAPAWARILYDRLEREFGPERVFMDIDDIPLGVNFHDRIDETLQHCTAVLVVIGPRWLTVTGADGRRRLNDKDDFVVSEVARAMEAEKFVLPILVDDATMPSPEDLPLRLRPLSAINALSIDHAGFRRGADDLIASLREGAGLEPGPARRPEHPPVDGRRRGSVAAVAAAAAAAIFAVGLVLALRDGGGPETPPEATSTEPGDAPVVTSTLGLGGFPEDVAVIEGTVLVSGGPDGTFYTVGPDSGGASTSSIIPGTSPGDIENVGDDAWVLGFDGPRLVSRLNPGFSGSTATVALGRSPQVMASNSGQLWVTNADDGTVSVVDTESEAVVETISLGQNPIGIALTDDAAWIADIDLSAVLVVDRDGYTLIDTIGVLNPARIAISDDAVWVTSVGDDVVQVIDPDTMTVTDTIPVGDEPDEIVVAGDHVWVANRSGSISVIDAERREVIHTIELGGSVTGLAADGDGVWVTNSLLGTLSRIEPA